MIQAQLPGAAGIDVHVGRELVAVVGIHAAVTVVVHLRQRTDQESQVVVVGESGQYADVPARFGDFFPERDGDGVVPVVFRRPPAFVGQGGESGKMQGKEQQDGVDVFHGVVVSDYAAKVRPSPILEEINR